MRLSQKETTKLEQWSKAKEVQGRHKPCSPSLQTLATRDATHTDVRGVAGGVSVTATSLCMCRQA